MTPDQYCQQEVLRSGSSFYYSFLFLPPKKRRAITAVYAFCRHVDDVVDECSDLEIANAKLNWWQGEIDALYANRPSHPITKALLEFIHEYDIKQAQLQGIISGMQMDLEVMRYTDFEMLANYCWHVAGLVGEISAQIFGFQDKQTLAYAALLGRAFQLTNIIRDVGDDARRGRIYLPVEDLQKFNVPAADILNQQHTEGFVKLMAFQVKRAQASYAQAFALLPDIDRHAQRPGLIMAAIYRTLLDEIAAENYRVLTQRISLTPLRKLWLAWKTYITSGRKLLRQHNVLPSSAQDGQA